MYSRSSNRPSSPKPIHLPEHYSGCAFSSVGLPHGQDPLPDPPPDRPSVPAPPAPIHPDPPLSESDRLPPLPPLPPPDFLHGWLGHFGRSLPFSHGLSADELLLVALILLLARSGQDPDLPLLLVLLLFC